MKTLKHENVRMLEHKSIRIIVFMFLCFYFLAVLFAPAVSFAYTLEVGIPGQSSADGTTICDPATGACTPTSLVTYLEGMYRFAMWGVGLAAFVMLVWAGMQWIVSGLPDAKADAMEQIKAALMGLGLVLLSVLILQTINPQLVKTELPPVSPPGGGGADLSVSRPTKYGCMDTNGNLVGSTSDLPVDSCPSPQIMMAYVWNSSKNCFERFNRTGCEAIGGEDTELPKVYGCRDNTGKVVGSVSRNQVSCGTGLTMIGLTWSGSKSCYVQPIDDTPWSNTCEEVTVGN